MEEALAALLREIQSGSDESFEKLKVQYAPLIASMVSSFYASGSGAKDELLQEARSALLKAALTYDHTQREVTFGLYAKICIRNALISHRRKVLCRTQQDMPSAPAEKKEARRVIVRVQDAQRVVARLADSLSPYECQVLEEYMAGKSVPEIAAAVGKNPKSIYNALFRIRQKAKQLEQTEG